MTRDIADVRTYEDLVVYLREWSNFGDTPAHDVVGMTRLLGACLSNLSVYADAEDVLPDIVESLEPRQAEFLTRLAGFVRRGR